MAKDVQSIEDLIKSSKKGAPDDDESALGKFAKKQSEIQAKEMERQVKANAAKASRPYINLFAFPISPEALILVEEEQAIRLNAVCFYYDGNNIRLGTTKITDEILVVLDSLCARYFCKGDVYLISERSLKYALGVYKTIPKIPEIVRGVEIKKEDLEKFENDISDYKSLNEKINQVNTSDVVTLILATALKTNSSDIHIEAEEHDIPVRFRIDGVLQEAARIDKDKWKRIISRMKLLAGVKMNITDKPQDGRYTIFLADDKVSVRSSFLPTNYGESVVMRLAKSSDVGLPFERLGMAERDLSLLEREIKKPNGLILVTGPTGSGKTTTLYAVLAKLNKPGVKIITLENPIEYQLEGINQSQVDDSRGYTFAKGLRSILRQDPDIVMVGEIRDLETAEISIQASLTGQLVLSTLHTNDAAGVVPRLVDMGVKPYFLTPAINAVVAQRLVRKLCPKCKQEHITTDEEKELVNKILAVISPKAGINIPAILPKMYKQGTGCEYCSGVGYKGRIGIYEVLTMSDDLKVLTAEEAPAFRILQQAIENGMVTMLQDGVLKCLDGITSLEEVYRVIGKFDYVDTLYDIVVTNAVGRGIRVSPAIEEKANALAIDLERAKSEINLAPSNEKLDLIMALAVKADVGDVHIDPRESQIKIRFRVDGVLHDVSELDKEHYIPILTKVKSLCGFPINVKKPAYDGRFAIAMSNQRRDCRVSIISGAYGETIVIRILVGDANALKMETLGIRSGNLNKITEAIHKTKGIIVTTGPTGSGKTTTLYSILDKLNSPEVKIITIEDPIEVRMEGIMQTQISAEEGYTFASALRSLMRQNPNIIMVGEIRDNETAKVAIEASQTGHLVLSTIHANNAAGAIARFVGLGVDRQSLANSLETSIGQRLVRKICPHCKEEITPPPNVIEETEKILKSISPLVGVEIPKKLKFYDGKGCDKCGHIGYKGRVGLYEVIAMTPDMQKIIQVEAVTGDDIEKMAVKEGTLLMIQDGVLKALDGETSITEVFRVAK